VIYFTIFIC